MALIKIGTRGSDLALWQANFVKNKLMLFFMGARPANPTCVPLVVYGDYVPVFSANVAGCCCQLVVRLLL